MYKNTIYISISWFGDFQWKNTDVSRTVSRDLYIFGPSLGTV